MPLSPNIRLIDEADEPQYKPVDVSVTEEPDDGADVPEYDDKGAILRIKHADGSITVSLDGRPISDPRSNHDDGWYANLAERIDDSELSKIAEDLLRLIQIDIESREQWIEDRAQGIKLLGLTIEIPGVSSSSDSPVEGMSKVRHPLLQEAVLRFQANARAEMLPTDGPVKIRDDDNGSTPERDEIATALETDLNHYLTTVAEEYYDDTDKMFLLLGFGGTTFKKVYQCPLRMRPVSETVDADDLIVNNSATNLATAKRITHKITMTPSTVRRMQLLGAYLDVDLGQSTAQPLDSVKEAKDTQQGVRSTNSDPLDRDRLIYEVYCELDIPGYEHKWKGKVSGLEVPYVVTIDVASRRVLSVVRNYKEDKQRLPVARKRFVKYTFVPGLGFYDIGLLHILGNTTNAVTAAWRELLDAGMFSNFPGFLMAKSGSRQNTNTFRVPPGGAVTIDTQGAPISDAVMPLPYKEPSQALMALVENVVQTGQRAGGTSELQVGEGRADVPVGTTLAMIEQAMKVLNAVHKRMHTAQSQEFRLLVECFRENPESFWETNETPSAQWSRELFLKALDDNDLVPQADPNTASHAQRIMKIMGIKQLQAANPNMYDARAVDKVALRAMGWNNPQQFMTPDGTEEQMPPEMMKGIEEIKIAHQEADAKTMTAQANMLKAQQPAGGLNPKPAEDPSIKIAEMQLKAKQIEDQNARAREQDENRDRDREKDLQMEQMRLQIESEKEQAHMANLAVERDHERMMQESEHAHDAARVAAELADNEAERKHDK